MITLVLYALGAIGAAYIIGWSEISFRIRAGLAQIFPWFVALLECPVCFGFWFGLIAGGWWNPLALHVGAFDAAVITAFVTAGSNLLLARLGGITVPKEGT